MLENNISVRNGSNHSVISGEIQNRTERTYVDETNGPSRVIYYEYIANGKVIYTYTEEEYYDAATQILSYKYIISFPAISQDYDMSWNVTSLTYDSLDYSTTEENSSAQGYVQKGTDTEDTLDDQVQLTKKTAGQFYGNTQFIAFYPAMNTKNNFFDQYAYELDYVDSYLSRIDLSSTNGRYTTLADNALVSTFFTLEYYLDTATQYQIDFRNFIVKDASGNIVNPVDLVANPTYKILIDKLHANHGTTFADFEPGNEYNYNVEKAFILEFNGLEYYLYLCHYTYGTHDYYTYILWADTCVKNSGLKVSTTFTDIKHNTTFSSSIVNGSDDLYKSDASVGTTITNTSKAGVASYSDSMDQANIYPSDINSYVIRPHNGYVINTITITYGNGLAKINLRRDENGNVTGIDSYLYAGKYTYKYTYTNEGYIDFNGNTDERQDYQTATEYDSDNDCYINQISTWMYLFHGYDFISYDYNEATGYVTLLIYGIYGDCSIVATAESYVSFRLEANELTDFYAKDAATYIENNYSDRVYKNYIHKPTTVDEFNNYLTFGFEYYIGLDEDDNDTYNNGWSNETLDNTGKFAYSKNQISSFVFGKYMDGETPVYYLELIYIGKAKIFDAGVTFRTVNYNYTYRITDFMVANFENTQNSGNIFTTNTTSNTDLKVGDSTLVDVTASAGKSSYKSIFINDVRKLFKSSAIDNTNYGGYTMARFFVQPMRNNDEGTIGTLVHIDSYLYTKGNNDDRQARLDPLADNSWFNGHTLSRIRLDYYKANRDENLTQVTYKEFEGRTTEYFYGNSYDIYYTEIEGYTLYKFNYLGTDYFFDYDGNFYTYTNAVDKQDGYIRTKVVNGETKTTLPDSIRVSYSRAAGSTYGVFKFTIIADSNTFRTNFIKFYSKQKSLGITYKFNKHESTSPAKISGREYLTNGSIESNERTQSLFFNEVTLLSANNYSMVGYTFMGYSSENDWSNFSHWSRVDNWTIGTDTDIFNMDTNLIGRAFYSYNFYIEAIQSFSSEPTFVSHETIVTIDGENTNPYDYNFYNVLKDQIHDSLYFYNNVKLYSVWKANKYNIVFDMNDYSNVNPLNTTVSKGSTEAQFNVLNTNNVQMSILNTDHYDDPFYFVNDATYQQANENYENGYTDGYYYDSTKTRISMVVTFDSNDWYLVYNGKTYNLEDILIDRYGYSWYGWFVSTDGKLDSNFARFFNTDGKLNWTSVIASNRVIESRTLASKDTVDDSNRLKFDYDWICKTTFVEPKFDTSYEYRKNNTDRVDTLHRLDIEYLKLDESYNDVDFEYTRNYFRNTEFAGTSEYSDVYYNHNVYGKFKLYAGWQANTYTLAYDYGTYGIDTGKTNKTENNNLMHNEVVVSGKSILASAKQLRGTTSPLQSNSGDYNTLIFDVEYNPQYVTRIGYTFMGWRLGLTSVNSVSGFAIDNSDNSAVTIDEKVSIASKGSKICINYNSIIIDDGSETTGVTTNCYLYRDMSNVAGSSETLGAFETLGDSESDCNSTLNHYVGMYAMWKTNIYTVKLDVNASANDTTTSNYFLTNSLERQPLASGIIPVNIYVIFDTNVWYYETTSSGMDLTDVILEKFGYFFLGWYTDAEAKEGRNILSQDTINSAHYTDFLMTGTDYNYTNSYNTYPDRIDDFDVYIQNAARTTAVQRLASAPQMRVLDYALFNQFVFRTYGETSTNSNLYTFESRLKTAYSKVNGYTITNDDKMFTSNVTDEYSLASRKGNWVEIRNYNESTKTETTTFEITIYAKWQGIVYEISFNGTSFEDDSGIGTTKAQYITEKNGQTYNSDSANCSIYVMFDRNLYTSSYNEIWQVESDYYAQIADNANDIEAITKGLHLNEIINIDRYGYTWTGWYTRGYEYLPDQTFNEVSIKHATNGTKSESIPSETGDTRVPTYTVEQNDGTNYYVGKMLETDNVYMETDGFNHRYYSSLIVDGHDYSQKTYRSSYSTNYVPITNYNKANYGTAAYTKFSFPIYSDLQTFETNKEDKTFTFTLYAGWEANTYQVYYESNSDSSYDNNWLDGVNTHGLPYVSGAKLRSEYSNLAIGSSPAYKITAYNGTPYSATLLFDGDYENGDNEGYVECTAWQRFGYTFIGYSMGHGTATDTSSAHFYATVDSGAKSTLVKLDYYAVAFGTNNYASSGRNDYNYSGVSCLNSDAYLYGTYDIASKDLSDTTKRDYEELGDKYETSLISTSTNNYSNFLNDGKKTYTYAVVLNAFYRANVYNVGFDSNDCTDGRGSTYAFFKDTDGLDATGNPYPAELKHTYIEENCDRNGAISVTFDTADWSFNAENGGFAMSDIRADRFGYTWMGWYTRSTCFNIDGNIDDVWKAYYYYLIMTGNSAGESDKIMEKFDYSLFLTYFVDESAVTEGRNYSQETHNDKMNITWNENENSFIVSGDAIIEKYHEHLITIFAGWQANTYSLTYYYSDVDSIKNYDNNLSNPFSGATYSYRTSSPIETLSRYEAGNLQTTDDLTKQFFRTEMIFDKEYSPEFLTRIGYTFKGWRFGLNSSTANYNGTFIENQRAKNGTFASGEKIILDNNSIVNVLIDSSGIKYECYLYTDTIYSDIDIGNDNYFRLGNIEELGDTDTEFNFKISNDGECTGLNFSVTKHTAQLFAMWENNVYTVEFNVNRDFNYTNDQTGYLQEDSTIANYLYRLAYLATPTTIGANRQIKTNSTLQQLGNDDKLYNIGTDVTSLLSIDLSLNRIYSTKLISSLLTDLDGENKYAEKLDSEGFLFSREDFDNISLDFGDFNYNGNYTSGDKNGQKYRYVAYVTFDTNDWWFETIDGSTIEETLYFMILEKLGYYFKGWYVNDDCNDNQMLIRYYEGEGDQNQILGFFNISGAMDNYTYREDTTADNKWYMYTNPTTKAVTSDPDYSYFYNERISTFSYLPRINYKFYLQFDKEIKAREQAEDFTYGKTTEGTWTENRKTGTYGFTLFAKWTNKVYTVEDFDGNMGKGSTNPKFFIDNTQSYTIYGGACYAFGTYTEANHSLSWAEAGIEIKILFDSDNFFAVYKNGDQEIIINEYINNIMVDRYGYTWTGWSSNLDLIDRTQVIDGHQPNEKWTYSNDYDYDDETKKACDAVHFGYDILRYAQTKSEVERKLTLYATWIANTYALTFDFRDSVSSETSKTGSSDAMFGDNTLTKYRNIVFDMNYDVKKYMFTVKRNGYTFVGWRFGIIDEETNSIIYGDRIDSGNIFCLNNDRIMNGDNVLLFTRDFTGGFENALLYQETYGDMEGLNHPTNIAGEGMVHFVYVFAEWSAIEYTIEFYGNRLYGSTTPIFNTRGEFNNDYCDIRLYVKFDSNNYYLKGEDGTIIDNSIFNVLVDRYGYTWTGWYYIYGNYKNDIIYSDTTKNRDSYFHFNDEYMIIPGTSMRDENTSPKTFTNDIFSTLFGSRSHESDLTEDFTTIRLYAGWEANTYSIIYNTADAGSDLQYYNDAYSHSNLGKSQKSNKSVGSTKINLEQSLTQMSGKNIATITFDDSNNTSFFQLIRSGYIFRGWSLYRNDTTSGSYDANDSSFALMQSNYQKPSQVTDHLLLNKTYATDEYENNKDTSCTTTNAFLYYFLEDSDEYVHETLGDNETERERVVVYYACWEARTYLVSFNVNNSYTKIMDDPNEKARQIQSSTTPGPIKNKNDNVTYNVFVTFDTSDWFGVPVDGGDKTSSIISLLYVEKLGYSWLGWYTTPTLNCDTDDGSYISSKVYDALTGETGETLLTLDANTFYNVAQYSSEYDGYIANNGYNATEKQCYHSGTITLFAGWQQNTYQVEVISRDSNTVGSTGAINWSIGSTPAFFRDNATGLYNETYYNGEDKPLYLLNVYFDSNEFYITKLIDGEYVQINKTVADGTERYNLYYLLLDRYGYRWNGFYYDLEGLAQNQIVPGHTSVGLSDSPNSYISSGAIAMFTNRTYQVASRYYSDIETDKKFYIFASWVANEYSLIYDYRDASENSVNGNLGSTNASIITTDFTQKILFDNTRTTLGSQLYYYQVKASRIGYDFLGWNLNTAMFNDASYNGNYPATYSVVDNFGNANDDFFLRMNNDFMSYDNKMMLYSQYSSDSTNSVETLGDTENEHYIALIAVWVAREYKLILNGNDSSENNGSTSVEYKNPDNENLENIHVVFDTNNYMLKDSSGSIVDNQYINKVKFDRFGYSLLGWTYNKVYARNLNTSSPNYLYDLANMLINNLANDSYIANNVNETEKTITVYACWKANEYTINFNYNAPTTGNLTPNYSLSNIDSFSSRNVASIIGSTLSTSHSETIKVTFDETIRIPNISRNGYDFLGYALDGDLSIARIFTPGNNNTPIILNDETYHNGSNSFIYDNDSPETLGEKTLNGSVYSINVHALWSPIKYSVKINANTSTGSSLAYIFDINTGIYLVTPAIADLAYFIEFDTNIWSKDISYSNNDLTELIFGRVGYSWSGLYPTIDCTLSERMMNVEGEIATRTLDSSLFDDLGENINLRTKIITIYAGWNAKTYNVNINHNLSNLGNTYNDETSKVSFLTNGTASATYNKTISITFDSANWLNLLGRDSDTIMDRYGFDWNYLYSTSYSAIGSEITSSTTLNLSLLSNILYDKLLENVNQIDILNDFDNETEFEVFARWNAHIYTVQFNYNDARYNGSGYTNATTTKGGTETEIAQEFKVQLGQTLAVPDMFRVGYKFKGWIIGDKDGRILTSITEEEYETFRIDDNGTFNYDYLNLIASRLSNMIPLYFKNSDSADFTNEVLGDEDKSATERKIYVFALYSSVEFKIRFELNDSAVNNGSTKAFFENEGVYNYDTCTATCTIKFASNNWVGVDDVKIARFGYDWTGWYCSSTTNDSNFVVFKDNKPMLDYLLYTKLQFEIGEDEEDVYIVLYAGWKAKNYTVVYDVSYTSPEAGGTNISNDLTQFSTLPTITQTFTFDSNVPVYKLSKIGFDFIGWSFDPAKYTYSIDTGKSTRESNLSIIYLNNVEENFGIIKFGNMSYFENNLTNYTYDSIVDNSGTSLISYQNDNEFIYCLYNDEACTVRESYADGSSTHFVKLYAVWAPKTYQITLKFNDAQDSNNGSTDAYISKDLWSYSLLNFENYTEQVRNGNSDWKWFITIDKPFGKLTLSEAQIDRYGYTFMGWYLFDGADGLFVSPKQETASVLTIDKLVEYINYLESQGLTASESELVLTAHWQVNTYEICYATNPIGGSTTVYQVNEIQQGNSQTKYFYNSTMQQTIDFDSRADFSFIRLGYDFNGYSFVNYSKWEGETLNYKNGASNIMLNKTNIISSSTNRCYLYSEPTRSDKLDEDVEFEAYGDNEANHYIVIYVFWTAIEYDITVAMNNSGLYNFNQVDSGYKVKLNQNIIDMPKNSTVLNNGIFSQPNYITFAVKFDSRISSAVYRNITINYMTLMATGYTYTGLNTNPDKSLGEDLNLSLEGNILNEDLFYKLFIYSYSTGDDGSLNEYKTELGLSFELNEEDLTITRNDDIYSQKTFSLYAQYEINKYTISIQDLDSSDYGKGLYKLINSKEYDNSITDLSEGKVENLNVEFFSNEYAIMLPSSGGKYVSKIYLSYTTDFDATQRILSFTLSLDQTTHILTFEGNKTDYEALNYVFNGLELICGEYSNNVFNINDGTISTTINYADFVGGYSYLALKFTNIKTNIKIACEYSTQQYEVNIKKVVINDITDPTDPTGVATVFVDYGQYTLSDIMTLYTDQEYETSPVWFYNEAVAGNEIPTGDYTKYITHALVLVARYNLSDSFESKSVKFYTWNDGASSYKLYDSGKDYIFQGISVSVNILDNSTTINHYGAMKTLNGSNYSWTWADSPKSNFSFKFNASDSDWLDSGGIPQTNKYSSIYAARLKSIPQLNFAYGETFAVGYICLNAEQLLSKINSVLSENEKYTYSTILNVFEENIYWSVLDIVDDVAQIKFMGDSSSKLYGKIIQAPILTTETEIQSNVYAIQAYSDVSFSITEDARQFFTTTEDTLNVEVKNFQDTISYFEPNSDVIKYYNKNELRYVVLNESEFNAYNYYRSLGLSIETALSKVIENFNITSAKIQSSIDISSGYVFFYFNKMPDYDVHSIVAVCENFIKKNASAIEFYPTSNRFSFTEISISSSTNTVDNKEEISIIINKNLMNTDYETGSTKDTNGSIYGKSNLRFTMLNTNQILDFVASASKVTYLTSNIENLTIDTTGTFRKINKDSFIVAFLVDENETIISVAPNFIYVNTSDYVYKLIYISDLMFLDNKVDNSLVIADGKLIYSNINSNMMIKGNIDADNGMDIQKNNPIYYAVIPAQIFEKIANEVFYELSSTNQILKEFILANEGSTIHVLKTNTDSVNFAIDYASFEENVYYIVPFYSNNPVLGSATYFHFGLNFLKLDLSDSTLTRKTSVGFFSNKLRFKYSSVGTGLYNDTFTISIDVDDLDNKLFNYSSNQFESNNLSFISLTVNEIQSFANIYSKSNSTELYQFSYNDVTYYLKDFNIEQTIEYVLYALKYPNSAQTRNLLTTITNAAEIIDEKKVISGELFSKTVKEYDVESIGLLEENSLNVNNSVGNNGYIIGLVIDNLNNKTIHKVTTNFVRYEVRENNRIVTSLSTILNIIDSVNS